MKRTRIGMSLVAVAIVLVAAGCRKTNNTSLLNTHEFQIGSIEPLTGVAAGYGERDKRGIELAISQLEAEHSGFRFVLHAEDGQFTPKVSVDAYDKLRASGKIDALLSFGSPQSLAVQPKAKADGLLHMGTSTSASSFSTPEDLSFRISPPTEWEVKTLAQLVLRLQAKRVAVLYSNNEVGVSVSKAFKGLITNLKPSPELVADEAFAVDAADYRTHLTKIKNAKPDLVFIVGLAKHVGTSLKQSQEIGLQTKFISFRGAEDPELVVIAGPAAEGLIYTYGFDESSNHAETQAFVKKYTDKYGEVPNGYSAEGYAAMRVVGEALIKCNTDTACQQQYLFGLQSYPSIFGPLSFDRNGDVFYEFYLKTVKDGKFVKLDD